MHHNKTLIVLKSLFLCLSIAVISVSCNNSKDKSSNEIDQSMKDDSIKGANNLRNEREVYRTNLQIRIDSLDNKMRVNDSLYDNKKEKNREAWLKNRDRLKGRITHLKKSKENVGNVSSDKWDAFKLESDTAYQNVKTDWNNTVDKMKAK